VKRGPLKLENVACGVCKSTDATPFATGKDFEYDTCDEVFSMVECAHCGNVYLNPRPAVDELDVIYPTNYYSYNYEKAINPIALRAKDILDQRKVKGWLKHVDADISELKFLDVGCGNGHFLFMLEKLGVPKDHLFGVEMSESSIERLKKSGFHGHLGRIEDVFSSLPAGSFDLIVLLQVLEHVEDPAAQVGVLSRLLRPGGLLIVETPNTESFDVGLFKRSYWGGYHFPRHWNLFNESTLRSLASQNSLSVKSFNYLPAHSFWIFSFHHYFMDRVKNDFVANFFDPHQNIFLLGLFTGLDIVRARLGFKTSNVQMVAQRKE
jgi:2-polyprenyl-3-methyl-5-hydroxy-6-metoxy-1,4-benzoquinol methylase